MISQSKGSATAASIATKEYEQQHSQVDETAALHLGTTFAGSAKVASPDMRHLQWAKRLMVRPVDEEDESWREYAGWFIERREEDEALCTALDALCARTNEKGRPLAARVIAEHQGETGPRHVEHYVARRLSLYLICEGVQSFAVARKTEERWGVVMIPWSASHQTTIKFQCLVKELAEEGYYEPLLVTFTSTITDHVLRALGRQYDVLRAADSLRRGHDPLAPGVPYYAYALPLGPGTPYGASGKHGQTSKVTPPVALIPNPLILAYLAHMAADEVVIGSIEGRLAEVIAWSIAESKVTAQPAASPPVEMGYEEMVPPEEFNYEPFA